MTHLSKQEYAKESKSLYEFIKVQIHLIISLPLSPLSITMTLCFHRALAQMVVMTLQHCLAPNSDDLQR